MNEIMDATRLRRVRDAMSIRRYGVSYDKADALDQNKIDAKIAAPILSTDGVVLVHGETRVFTNNLDRGVVELSRLSYEWHAGENRWVPWFDVMVDTTYKGESVKPYGVDQSDDRVAVRFNGRTA